MATKRAQPRCDAMRRDATDESGNTFPSSSSGSISICLLRLYVHALQRQAAVCTVERVRPRRRRRAPPAGGSTPVRAAVAGRAATRSHIPPSPLCPAAPRPRSCRRRPNILDRDGGSCRLSPKQPSIFFYLFSIIRRLKNSHGRAPRRLYGARRPRHHTIASSGSTEQRPV